MKLLGLISLLLVATITYVECSNDAKYVIYDLNKAGELFAKFRHDFGKNYASPKETHHRFEIFRNNLIEINRINSQHLSWYAGINQFADMTGQEVQKCCMGFRPSKKNNKKLKFKPRTRMVILDSSLDDSSGSK